jgi:hypothetical protein
MKRTMKQPTIHIAMSQHVLPAPSGGWSVRQYGAARASKTFKTKAAAIRYGQRLAKDRAAELFVHDADGAIQRRERYELKSSMAQAS